MHTPGSRHPVLLLLVLAGFVSACQSDTADHPHASLGLPGAANESASVAADGDRVVVAWLALDAERRADAYVAVSRDGGTTFGRPARVNDVPGDVRASQQQAPRVALAAGRIAVLWTARRDGETEIRLAESHDDGRSFEASRPISPSGAPGTRGWGAVAFDAAGRLRVVWLDTRVAANAKAAVASPDQDHRAHDMSAHAGAGVSATRQDVWTAVVEPGGRVSDRMLAPDVCFCCKTTLVRAGARLAAAWRDVYDEDLRDISFTWVDDALDRPLVRVSEDQWHAAGCPEDGPALAASVETLHLVWPTMVKTGDELTKGVFYASSGDGLTFSPRTRLDPDTGGAHPAMAAVAGGDLLAVWEVARGTTREIAARYFTSNAWQPVQVVSGTDQAASPSVAATADAFVVAWEQRVEGERVIRVVTMPHRPVP